MFITTQINTSYVTSYDSEFLDKLTLHVWKIMEFSVRISISDMI